MKDYHIVPGKRWVEILLLLLSDLIGFAMAVGLVTVVRYLIMQIQENLLSEPLIVQAQGDLLVDPVVMRTLLLLLVFSIVMMIARGLYPGWERSSVVELKQIVEAITMAYIFASVIIFIQRVFIDFSRSVYILSWFFSVFIIPIGRFLIRKLISRSAWWGEPVALIGLEKGIREIATELAKCPRLGLRPVIGLAVDGKASQVDGQVQIIPWTQEAQSGIQKAGVRTSILAIPSSDLRKDYPQVFRHVQLSFRKTVFILDDTIFSFMMAQPVDIAGLPAILSRQSLFNPATLFAKRVIDMCYVAILFIPILLLGALLTLLIKIDSPGPILYRQTRVGRDGKPFRVFKFRTMVRNADEVLAKLLEDPEARAEWEQFHKLTDDKRITRVGKWLRNFSLDELPQVINIFRGEMSLIGPRPLLQEEIDEMGEAAARVVLHVRPGMTGWWQVMGRNDLTFQERTHLDLYYVFNWSLWLDLFIIIKTFWVVLFVREGK